MTAGVAIVVRGAWRVLALSSATPTTGATLPVNTESHGGRVGALIAIAVLAAVAGVAWYGFRLRRRLSRRPGPR